MVGSGGLEPPTPSVSRKYSNQLSYEPTKVGLIIVMASGASGQIAAYLACLVLVFSESTQRSESISTFFGAIGRRTENGVFGPAA